MHQGISVVTWFRLSRNHPLATVQYDNSGASAISKLHPQPDADETTLAKLGFKQEFYREFTPLELCWSSSFNSFCALLCNTKRWAFRDGLGCKLSSHVRIPTSHFPSAQWAFACPFIMCIGMAMAELASPAPTSGGLYYWTYSLASPRCRNFLSWIVGYSNTTGIITGVGKTDFDDGKNEGEGIDEVHQSFVSHLIDEREDDKGGDGDDGGVEGEVIDNDVQKRKAFVYHLKDEKRYN
ncbi:uncharacterized protein F5891DRAFT_1189228 [Suillus fuscotomentosus]|uniref:Uncharacterized protein n=1 Tax=Suillus fuscotomentosus TaxID=1912939 RepID=A0AAD4HKB8_9AGAM|nr:uncharacterized protein F5891DRAFT_1189228 [Suillus fuscotomentosus]KAG1899773.1 hypothetical protein F5891DRAFT_1189228 [Suillus fuscotomentosus]